MPTLPYDKTEIETLIRAALPCEEGLQRTVIQAMREAVENGGKRIRPILLFETCRCFAARRGETGWKEEAAPFLAALEMIHSFSLVHDDLPCMDNDTLRRGKPTTWYVYGEAMGTLAGDGLVLEALTVAGRAVGQSRHPERAARALAILGEKSGVFGMLGGQSVDVEKTGEHLDATTLDFIYRLKTGALLEAAFMMGAALGGASEAEISCAEQIGRAVSRSRFRTTSSTRPRPRQSSANLCTRMKKIRRRPMFPFLGWKPRERLSDNRVKRQSSAFGSSRARQRHSRRSLLISRTVASEDGESYESIGSNQRTGGHTPHTGSGMGGARVRNPALSDFALRGVGRTSREQSRRRGAHDGHVFELLSAGR